MRLSIRIAGAAALAVVAASGAALAGHGKVGLWQITTKMDMSGMPQIPPDQAAKMRAMGVETPSNGIFTTTHCMTAEEVAMDKPPSALAHGKECAMQNLKTEGQNVSADMVCSGKEMNGKGHFTLAYDTLEHYTGKVTFSGAARGHPMTTTTTFEAKWVSADCKGAAK